MGSERPIINQITEFENSLQSEGFGIEHLRQAASELANPTLDTIAHYSQLYAQNLTYDEVRSLYYSFYDLPRNAPQSFFEERGPNFGRGLANLREVLNELSQQYDTETRSLRDDFDEHEVAVLVAENIQLVEAEDELELLTALVNIEPDYTRRATLAARLKQRVLAFISQFNVSIGNDEPKIPSWKDITDTFNWNARIVNPHRTSDSTSQFDDAVYTAHAAIERKKFERRLQKLGSVDRERFHNLRLQYGVKGAHLLLINEMMDDINGLFDEYLGLAEVPEFTLVPVDVYNAWKNGETIDEMLKPYFDWASQLYDEEEPAPYIVRSSAVFSEDGEEKTGAGKYTSVEVPAGAKYEQFKRAIVEVFESTQSPLALAYQAKAGVEEEQMGLVIQKYVTVDDRGTKGIVNSTVVGVPPPNGSYIK